MKQLNYRKPYEGGRAAAWLNDLRNQSGVYIIRSMDTGETLYVGESHTGRLAKTIKRHFHPWKDNAERKHHTYSPHRVEVAVRLCPPASAPHAQNNLIGRLDPRDNGNGFPAEKPF